MQAVSVLLPTVRIDPWFITAAQSVLSSQDVQIELIIIFDGIHDVELPPSLVDSRVKIVKHPSRVGLPTGLMSGMQEASHEFIARIDADDVMLPNRLFKQVTYLSEHPETVAVGSAVMIIDENSKVIREMDLPTGDDIRKHFLLQNVIAHPAVMFRRKAIISIGGYDTSMKQMEDYDLWLRLSLLGPIANLRESLTYYRVHSHQMSSGSRPYGYHIKKVLQGRRMLAIKYEGIILLQFFRDAVWVGVQYLRFYNIIGVGYTRRARLKFTSNSHPLGCRDPQ